jgi:hypothetical protein
MITVTEATHALQKLRRQISSAESLSRWIVKKVVVVICHWRPRDPFQHRENLGSFASLSDFAVGT